MLLAAYLEMFHGSILLNCWLRGCNYHNNRPLEKCQIFSIVFWSLGIFTLDSYVSQTYKTVFSYIKGKLKTIVGSVHESIAYAQDTGTT